VGEHGMIFQRQYRPIVYTISIGVIVSLFLFKVVNNWEQKNQRIEFESRAMGYANAIQNNFRSNIEALRAVGDFFNHHKQVSRKDFSIFVDNFLSRHSSIQAFSWNPLVQDNERAGYELLAKAEGFENFQFTERSEEKKLVRAGQRPEYVVVYYIEPQEVNKPAMGFDISSNPTRLKAINKGFDTGKLSATDRITLVQETASQTGILLLLPIYQQKIHTGTPEERHRYRKGFLVAVLRVGDVVKNAIEKFSDEGIELYIFDNSAHKEENRFLHFQPSTNSQKTESPVEKEVIREGLHWSRKFDFADRQWEILFQPSTSYIDSQELWYAWVVLSGSILYVLMFAFYLLKKVNYASETEKRMREQVQTNQQLKKEITERKQAEKELNQRRNQYERLVERTPAILYTFSTLKGGTYYSPQVESILGYSCDHLLKNPFLWNESIHEDDKKLIERTILQSKKKNEFEVEYRIKDTQGNWHWFLDRSIGIRQSPEETLIEGLAIDITERENAENEKIALQTRLNQAQKMEAIGTLAGGIAHDFNNILGAILGYTEMALADIPPDSKVANDLQRVMKAGNRAKDLVRQILTFSRKSDQELKPLRIQVVVIEALKLLRSSIPTTIEISQNIDPDCGAVLADTTQIHQVIMNLCTNAYHAMGETGGKLGVSLESIDLTPEGVSSKISLQPGSYVKLEISDTGRGIMKANLERIFEPYFTTKAKGEGTGLGLSLVHGMVISFGGDIAVYSELGKGTVFQIYLPIVRESKEVIPAKDTAPLPTGDERIILVDDDKELAQMNKTVLESLGYKVTALTSSAETLDTFQKDPDGFDLVLTDMTMPNITGSELSERILAIRPDIPIILCTGYSGLINEEKAKKLGIREYVMKPVTMKSLAKVVRKVLDASDISTQEDAKAMATILVVDDDYEFREMVKLLLKKEGYSVREATDGKDAVDMYRAEPCGLIIIDLFMREKQGIDTIEKLRKEYPEVKIIAVSEGHEGKDDNKEILLAKEQGAIQVFGKPIEKEKLLTAIRKVLV
jgi:PAS domain S-box-containing protein